MNTFSNAVASQQSAAASRTENGMKAWATSDSKALDAADRLADAYASLCNMTGKNYHEHEGSCYAAYRAARGGKA